MLHSALSNLGTGCTPTGPAMWYVVPGLCNCASGCCAPTTRRYLLEASIQANSLLPFVLDMPSLTSRAGQAHLTELRTLRTMHASARWDAAVVKTASSDVFAYRRRCSQR